MLCRFTVYLLFFLTSFQAFSQSVSGVVTDKHHLPLPGAAVKLLTEGDSLFKYGGATDEQGTFRIKANPGRYLIMVSMLGFQNRRVPLDIRGDIALALDTIVLTEDVQQLREAVVKQRRPAIRFEAGTMIITPDLSIVAGQGDVFSVLRNTPGLFASDEGRIALNGQNGVNIRVNGKETYLTGMALANFLKSLPAGSVEAIEVITSPSSAYDAAGKAGVINIKLKKHASEGFSVGARGNFQQSRRTRSDWGVRAAVGKRRFGFGIDYSGAASERFKQGTLVRTLETESIGYHADQTVAFRNQDIMHGSKIFSDFQVSKRLSVEAYAGRNFYQRTIPGQSITNFMGNGGITDSTLRTTSHSRYRQITNNGGLQAVYRDERQRELTVAVDHLSFRHREALAMGSVTRDPGRDRETQDTLGGAFGDHIQALAAQADWQSPLTKRIRLQAGLKTAGVAIDNQVLYTSIRAGLPQHSNERVVYKYAERTSAAYAQVSGNFKKWSYRAGVRAEHTTLHGAVTQLDTQSDSTYRKGYTRLFPSVHVQLQLTEAQQLAVSYNHRITRPNYRDLSPSGYIVDRYVMVNGNPALLPELTHNTEVSYLMGRSWRGSAWFVTNTQSIAQVFRAGTGGRLLITPENLSSRKTVGMKLDGTDILPVSWWQLGGTVSVSCVVNQWTEERILFSSRTVVPAAHLSNGWIFGLGWAAELSADFNGRVPMGQVEMPPVWSVSAGIRKKMAGDRLVIRLYGTDLLASIRERSVFRNQYVYGKTNLRYEETYMGLSVQYTFKRGNQKELKEKNSEEKKRINF